MLDKSDFLAKLYLDSIIACTNLNIYIKRELGDSAMHNTDRLCAMDRFSFLKSK
jgi:hypothetical protein